jgi:hypothetical protein
MDDQPTVLVVGDFSGENIDFAPLCRGFGWKVLPAESLDSLDLDKCGDVIAGIIDPSADGEAILRKAHRTFPDILWIACCRFGSAWEWNDLENSGVFHLVRRPLHPAEVLQSLGFVDATLCRRQRRPLQMPLRNAVA